MRDSATHADDAACGARNKNRTASRHGGSSNVSECSLKPPRQMFLRSSSFASGVTLPNDAEAARVRDIFALYLEYQALLPVVRELHRRGWRTKRWRTRKGHVRGGRAFTRNT